MLQRMTSLTLLTISLLSGCQTGDDLLADPSDPVSVSGPTASAIAGDMASRFAEQLRPAETTIFTMDKDTSEYAAALEAALKGWGYSILIDEKVSTDSKPIEIAWSIDRFDGYILARVSTPTVAIGRAYTPTSAGAIPASPLSVMRRNGGR